MLLIVCDLIFIWWFVSFNCLNLARYNYTHFKKHVQSQCLFEKVLLSFNFSMMCLVYYYLSVWFFSFLAMALSVYFRSMSLNVPLVSFPSSLPNFWYFWSVNVFIYGFSNILSHIFLFKFSISVEQLHFNWWYNHINFSLVDDHDNQRCDIVNDFSIHIQSYQFNTI